jgi:hypothetical protein
LDSSRHKWGPEKRSWYQKGSKDKSLRQETTINWFVLEKAVLDKSTKINEYIFPIEFEGL